MHFTFRRNNILLNETPQLSKPRVLIVDDNADAADTLASLLEIFDWPAHVAYSGIEAIAMADLVLPRLVILDISMPHMDGFETARKLRARPSGEQVSIAALTAWGDEHTRCCTKEAGMEFHLTKPVSIESLLGVLEQIRA